MQLTSPETDPADRSSEPTATENPSAEPSTATAEELPLDVVFELLSNERRRRVMRYLLEEGETTLGELAERIAAIENEKPEEALSSTERKRVYICLYQCHLPKLDDAGAIDFDEHRKTVTVGPSVASLRPYLPEDEPTHAADPWPEYYLGIALAGAGLLAVQSLLLPLAWLSGALIGVLLAVVTLAAIDQLRRLDRLPVEADFPFPWTAPSASDQ